MAARAQPECGESKLIGSKLIFKGMVEIYLLLQEPGGALVTSHESLPFSQAIEVSGTDGEGIVRWRWRLPPSGATRTRRTDGRWMWNWSCWPKPRCGAAGR